MTWPKRAGISVATRWICPPKVNRLHADPSFRTKVEAAERLGISLKRFDGWEERTYHEYDEQGHLIVSIRESEWDAEESAWMLALAIYRDNLCQQCGGDMRETTASANEDRYRFIEPVACFRCVAFEQAREEYASNPYPRSLMHRAELKKRGGGVS